MQTVTRLCPFAQFQNRIDVWLTFRLRCSSFFSFARFMLTSFPSEVPVSQGCSKLVIDEIRKLINLSSKCFIYKISLQLHSPHPSQCLTFLTSLSLTKLENKRPRNHTHVCLGVLHRKCFNTYILDRICYNRLIIFSRIFSVFGNVFPWFFRCSILLHAYSM